MEVVVASAIAMVATAHLAAMNAIGASGSLSLHTADLLTPGDCAPNSPPRG